ncbi:MAG TPA: hypothetical protein VFK76_02160 [Gaiellaceae bacterium]|nr:hypothetical protein [Gaiellaceae bacterium]
MAEPPRLRISESGGRVRLGLEGFGDVEGRTLQEAADRLVSRMLEVALAVRGGGPVQLSSECGIDPAELAFLWRLGEHVSRGGDPRELLFGRHPRPA